MKVKTRTEEEFRQIENGIRRMRGDCQDELDRLKQRIKFLESDNDNLRVSTLLACERLVTMHAALVKVKKLFDGRLMFQPAIRECHEMVNAALTAVGSGK